MSPAPPGLSGGDNIEKGRRLSFLKPNLKSPSSFTNSSSSPPRHRQNFDVNFHITSIRGIPTSWVNQYRVVASCGNERSPTSWRASTKPELLVVETTPLLERLQKFAQINFAIEKRSVLGKHTTIGKSKAFSVSELEEKQNASLSKCFTLGLVPVEGSQTILLELNIRLLSSAGGPEVPDGEARARPVFEIYTTTVSDTFSVWEGLDPRLPDFSRQISYRVLKEMMHQMHKYIYKHPRGIMSFKIEDNVWTFLRTTAERLETHKTSQKDKAPPREDFSLLAKQTFLGFRILLHLHRPHMGNCGKLQMEYFENELQAITKPSTRTRRSQSTASITTGGLEIYPELLKLKGVDMRLSCSQSSGFDLLYSTIAFQNIVRWMVDFEAEHQVFWLHGKFESGTARCPMAPALVEASRVLGFPAAYYSFSRGAAQTSGYHKTQDMLSSLIYQLSLFDISLAAAFNATITQSSEPFESLDFYSQFQVLLHTLLKLGSTDEVKIFPVILLIDDLEPMNGDQPSQEFSHLLQALYSASVATNDITPVSSSSSVDRHFDFLPTSSSSSSSETLRESLPFPPFLRTVVFSRSLGDKPSLIEKFAFIRDGHQLFGTHHNLNDKANKLYNSAINGPGKGKCGREEIPVEYSPLNPIAEVNSQASFI